MGRWVAALPDLVCPFDTVKQDYTLLGTYQSFSPLPENATQMAARMPLQALVDASTGTLPGRGILGHRTMTFVDGATCHNGVKRCVQQGAARRGCSESRGAHMPPWFDVVFIESFGVFLDCPVRCGCQMCDLAPVLAIGCVWTGCPVLFDWLCAWFGLCRLVAGKRQCTSTAPTTPCRHRYARPEGLCSVPAFVHLGLTAGLPPP